MSGNISASRRRGQNLVDAAYIAESFLRAYDELWVPLDDVTKQRYIKEFQGMRKIDPPYTNWLLFSSTIESFLAKAGAQYDEYRVNSTCRKMEEWYAGDGWYADGGIELGHYVVAYAVAAAEHDSHLAAQRVERGGRGGQFAAA